MPSQPWKLEVFVGTIGTAATVATTIFTLQLLQGPLRTISAFEVSHLASANCTAIARILTVLSQNSSETQSRSPELERVAPGTSDATVGVVNLGSGGLEIHHTSSLSKHEIEEILRRLPLDLSRDSQADSVSRALDNAPSGMKVELAQNLCNNLSFGRDSRAVRAYPIQGKPSGWMAFIYDPLTLRGENKASFALVNLQAHLWETADHDHEPNLPQFLPGVIEGGNVRVDVKIIPAAVLKNEANLHKALPVLDLKQEDQKLKALRIVPFANQLVSTQLSIDDNKLTLMSWRAASLVFLMGLLGTSSVVLMIRRSEIRLRTLNEALQQESRTDPLTRIANRRAWDESLNLEESRRQRHGHQYGLVVVDLDGFKQINDEQGHQMGDQVLQIAASQLAAQMRGTDLLARVGGDEFALMVFNPSAAGLDELVDRLRDALQGCGVQASIGAAMSEPQTTVEQTWAKADEAMYTYKPQTSKKLNPRQATDQSGHRA